jgi:hypothetical protein
MIFLRSVSQKAQCVLNIPSVTVNSFYNSTYLPGQFFTLDQQCMYASGAKSTYKYCSVSNSN